VPEDKKTKSVRLHRDSKGEVRPIEGVSPNLGITVKVSPLTYRTSRRLESFGEPLFNWSDEDKIYALNHHLVEPEMNIKDVDDLYDDFDGWVVEDLLQAIFLYSGMARLFEDPSEGNVGGEAEDNS